MRRLLPAILMVSFLVLGGAAPPAFAQDGEKRVIELTFKGGAVSGDVETAGGLGVVRVTQGDDVELRWTTDSAAELHLHGYNVRADLTAGAETVIPFSAKFGGRFALEAHVAGGGEETILFIEVRPK